MTTITISRPKHYTPIPGRDIQQQDYINAMTDYELKRRKEISVKGLSLAILTHYSRIRRLADRDLRLIQEKMSFEDRLEADATYCLPFILADGYIDNGNEDDALAMLRALKQRICKRFPSAHIEDVNQATQKAWIRAMEM